MRAANGGEHFQHRRGPGRHGRSNSNDDRSIGLCMAAVVYCSYRRPAGMVQLQPHRQGLQVANACFIRLCDCGISRTSALERRAQSHVRSSTET